MEIIHENWIIKMDETIQLYATVDSYRDYNYEKLHMQNLTYIKIGRLKI